LGKWFDSWFTETILGVGAILALLFSDQTRLYQLYLLLALICMRILGYILSYKAFEGFGRGPLGLSLMVLPALMIVAFGFGRDGAYTDLKSLKFEHRLYLKNKAFPKSVRLLRLLDKGALIVDSNSRALDFIPKEEIVMLS
jgi:hypothetical protein